MTRKLAILIALIVWGATAYSQNTLQRLDSLWLTDTVQKEIALRLAEGEYYTNQYKTCQLENKNLSFQLGILNKSAYNYRKQIQLYKSKDIDYQQKLLLSEKRIDIRDKELAKLRLTNWLVIGISGAVVAGTIIIATQVQ